MDEDFDDAFEASNSSACGDVPRSNVDPIIELIERQRDRFSTWGLLVSTLGAIVAIWMRAPSLEVEIPFAADAKISLNVGYVLALGMPLLAVASGWVMGPLMSMRVLQRALLSGAPNSYTAIERLRIEGQLRNAEHPEWLGRAAMRITVAMRLLVLFGLPVLATVIIGIRYFGGLQVYADRQYDVLRRDVSAREFFLGAHLVGRDGKPIEDPQFSIPDSRTEHACRELWKREAAARAREERVAASSPQEAKAGSDTGNSTEECSYDAFPRLVLPLNSALNIMSAAIVIGLNAFGARAYLGQGLPT